MSINYPHGEKKYLIKTPSRKKAVKRIVRRTYTSLTSGIVQSDAISGKIIAEISRKVTSEMKKFSSNETDSLLRDTNEAVKHFSWRTVYLEMKRHIPTLINLLSSIVPCAGEREQLVCMVAAQLLKSRHQKMCLVQRAVSVLMYGNGSTKAVNYLGKKNRANVIYFCSCM